MLNINYLGDLQELALANSSTRQGTVISNTSVELLVISIKVGGHIKPFSNEIKCFL